jgi:RNA polymerase sigma-70 factor (ECF subfamily)
MFRDSLESKNTEFDDIICRNKDIIFNLLFRLTGDFHTSEDLFQETFLKVHKGLNNYRGDSKISTWIYSIALNVYKDYGRKKKWHLPTVDHSKNEHNLQSAEYTDPEAQYILKEEKKDIQLHLNDLKDSLKVPVVLHYLEGLSIDDISRVTGKTVTNIKVSLHRARKVLKKRMVMKA